VSVGLGELKATRTTADSALMTSDAELVIVRARLTALLDRGRDRWSASEATAYAQLTAREEELTRT